jgi:hypothetical protein
MKTEQMFIKAQQRISDFIEMKCISALSSGEETPKELTNKLIESYLKKRGYVMNYILGRTIMVKGFVCAFIGDGFVEVWHDTFSHKKSVFIADSLLTGLPITMDYMERI